MSFQQSAWFLGKVVLFFRQIAGKTIALQGPHMCGPQLYGRRPPAGRARAGRLSAHNERRQFASKHARAVVCPAGANIVRSPVSLRSTVAPRSQPRSARPLRGGGNPINFAKNSKFPARNGAKPLDVFVIIVLAVSVIDCQPTEHLNTS